MKKKFFILFLMLLITGIMFGATVTIGNGTSTDRYPLGDYYVYQRSQMLFTSSEIGMSGSITHLRWYRNDTGATTGGDVEIWLKEVSDTTISGTTWEDPGTLVYSTSSLDLGSGDEWVEIDITDFSYSVTNNLLVSTYVQDAPYSSPHTYWRYTTTSPDYMMRRGQNDYTNPPSLSTSYYRPNIQFDVFVAGAPGDPSNPSPADNAIDVATDVDITWDFGADTATYDLWFGEAGNMTEVVSGAAAGTTGSYTPALLGGTEYEWQVICHSATADVTTNGPVWSFTTFFPPITTFPYEEDFEDGEIPGGWSNLNDLWSIGSEANSGNYCAKVSYSHSISDAILTCLPINLPPDYRIKFWWKDDDISDVGTNDYTYFEISTNNGVDWTTLATLSAASNMSDYEEVVLDLSSYSGDNVLIRWRDVTNSTYLAYGTGLDDITIEEIPQVPVFVIDPETKDFGQLIAGNSSETQTFTISNTGGADLIIDSEISFTGTNADQFTLTDLNSYPLTITPGGSADVDVEFTPTSGGDKTANLHIVDNTTTEVTHDIPLTGTAYPSDYVFESFETAVPPDGWTVENVDFGNDWEQYSSSSSPHGDYMARLYYTSTTGAQSRLITPKLDINSADDVLDFYCRYYSAGTLTIQYSSDAVTWTDLQVVPMTTTFDLYSIDLSSLASAEGEYYLAFLGATGTSYSYMYLDAVIHPRSAVIPAEVPTNPSPDDLAVDVLETVDLTWTNGYGTDTIDLYFGTDEIPVTKVLDNVTAVETYDPGTMSYSETYYWQVVCKNSYTEDEVSGPVWSFTTRDDPTIYSFPYTESFDTDILPANWLIDPVVAGDSWEFFNSDPGYGASGEHTGNDGYFAGVDDSTPDTVPAHLYTPPIDLTTLSYPILYFYYWIGEQTTDSELYIDIDNGTTATVDVDHFGETIDHWEPAIIDLTPWIGDTIIIDFRAMEGTGYYGDICLDDVQILDGGALSGNVSEYVTDSVIAGAEVMINGQTAITDVNGDYTITPIVPGTYDVTCSADGYIDALVEDVVITSDAITTQDIILTWAECTLNPTSINETLDSGATLTTQFTITNNGTGPLNYCCSLVEDTSTETMGYEQTYLPYNPNYERRNQPISEGYDLDTPRYEKKHEQAVDILRGSTAWFKGGEYSTYYYGTFDTDVPGSMIEILSPPAWNAYCGDFDGMNTDFFYINNCDNFNMYTVDCATGVATLLGPTGLTNYLNGLACHKAENIMYGCTATDLYTINLSTGEATLVGPMGTATMVDIAIDGQGNCWGIDIDNDNLYSVDLATGASTLVGPTGYDAGYAQTLNWDPETDVIYWACYGGGLDGNLRIVDTTTGATSFVGDFESGREVTVLAFPGGKTSISWLNLTSNFSGTIPAGGNTVVDVLLDAAGLSDVTRTGSININHNGQDVTETLATVDVTMNVNIVTTPPNPATNPTPADHAVDVDLLPLLSWSNNGVVNESTIEMRLSVFEPWHEIATITGTGNSYQIEEYLNYDRHYQWRVMNTNLIGNSSPSIWFFDTITADAANPTPADDDINVFVDATLDWDDVAHADSFLVYVWYDDGLADNPVMVVDGETALTSEYDPTEDFLNNTEYFWYVETYRAEEVRGTSETWSFTTITAEPVVPSNPTPEDDAVDISAFGVTLSWECLNADTYDVYLDPVGVDDPTTLIADDITTTSFSLTTALEWNTEYEWQVVASNAAERAVTNGPIWSFTTSSVTLSAPYTEDFEGDVSDWMMGGTNSSWEIDVPGGLGDFVANRNVNLKETKGKEPADIGNPDPATAHSGMKCAGTDLTDDGLYNDNELSGIMTSPIDCSALTNVQLSFWRYLNVEEDWDEAYVQVTNDGINWTSLGHPLYVEETEWTELVYDISTYAVGNVIQIRWILDSDSSNKYSGWNIDDISLYQVACLPPSDLTATNLTVNSADLGWTENNVPPATLWNIEWGLSGFTQGTGTMITGVTSNPYLLDGLTSDTTYDWYIQADSGTDDLSDWAGPHTFSTLFDGIQIGYGTSTGQHLPIESYYSYSYTQTIYQASDFGTINDYSQIDKIWYNYSWNGGDEDSDIWTIYMGTTANSTIDDWIPVGDLTQVFTGDVDLELVSGDGWLEITLDTPYAYNPADGNLVIAVDENEPSYTTTTDEFYCSQNTRANVSVYFYNDNTNPDPLSPPSVGTSYSSLSSYYPNTRFEFSIATPPATPTNVTAAVDGVGNTVLSWDAVTGANSYHVYGCDTPNGLFVDVTADGAFTDESWTSTAPMGDMKFFYITSDTIGGGDIIFTGSKRNKHKNSGSSNRNRRK